MGGVRFEIVWTFDARLPRAWSGAKLTLMQDSMAGTYPDDAIRHLVLDPAAMGLDTDSQLIGTAVHLIGGDHGFEARVIEIHTFEGCGDIRSGYHLCRRQIAFIRREQDRKQRISLVVLPVLNDRPTMQIKVGPSLCKFFDVVFQLLLVHFCQGFYAFIPA